MLQKSEKTFPHTNLGSDDIIACYDIIILWLRFPKSFGMNLSKGYTSSSSYHH